jgi:hypothetical protein
MKKLVVLLFLVVSVNVTWAEGPVYFADENLKTAVEAELGIIDPNSSDMLALTNLEAISKGINDLTGIEYALNLTHLDLWANDISDISAVSGLTNLTELELDGNQIGDISAVSGLTNLTVLWLSDNQIGDISAVSGLTNLTELSLWANLISNISAVSGLKNLTWLLLSNNQIGDISAVSGLTNLTELELDGNQISDISAVSGLTNLTRLYLYSNQISDISAVSGITNLTRLWLYNNPLDTLAYCIYISLIEENNPEIELIYDTNPNPVLGDCDGDCYVNLYDFVIIALRWLEKSCGDCDGADLNYDSNVDANDLELIAKNWLDQYTKFLEFTLDGDPNWTTEGQWEFGLPLGSGGYMYGYPDPNSGYTGANVYGANLNGDYSTIIGGPYYLTAGPFDCSGYQGVSLRFARWLNTDEADYVDCRIEVSNDGTVWSDVWVHALPRKEITDDRWVIKEYDISSVADNENTVYIRWGYEIFEYAYPYSGWNIDDIELWGNP